jgi:uncharacterized repeat protein (TIGR03803 family)
MKRTCSIGWVSFLFTFTFQLFLASQTAWPQSPHAKFQVLYAFQGQQDGGNPNGGLLQDAAGNLFGTTYDGGDLNCSNGIFPGCGVVFKLDRAGHETVLYRFKGGPGDGGYPCAEGVIRDSAGNLYGTTCYGGAFANNGIVFKLDSSGHETLLHSFTGGDDGGVPKAGLVRDAAGNLFGSTYYGGSPACNDGTGVGCGVVFKIDAAGKQKVLHRFTGGKGGANPMGTLLLDGEGNLYGTTFSGGSGDGVVFRLDSRGKETVLHEFAGRDGNGPAGVSIRHGEGTLYGTTYYGGFRDSFLGTIFRVDRAGKETVLHKFKGQGDGFSPDGLVADGAGNLYGITLGQASFTCDQDGCGTVFEVDTNGKFSLVYRFQGGPDGAYPQLGLIRDTAGALYGAAGFSGNQGCLGQGCGTVFKVIP